MTEGRDGVAVEDRDGVRLITLDRPDRLNAFNATVFAGITRALGEAAADDEILCVALTGNGRAFTAGSELSDDDAGEDTGADPYEAFMQAIETFPKPLVAAVNGLAVGIGTTMLGHCDLVLAAESARFRMPFTSLGLVPEAGSTATMPALLGRQPATHALLTSSWISAQDAARDGLVWRLVPDASLLDETWAVCAEVAAMPLDSLVATKHLLLAARTPAAVAAREREDPEFRRLLKGPAHAAAVEAFLARRQEKAS
jgi:enoyl-CoA hydratase/carnithine racemase